MLSGGAALTVLLLSLRLAQPWPLKWIIDGLLGAGTEPLSPTNAAALFLVASILAAYVEFWQVTTLVASGNRILYKLRASLFDHVLKQALAFHERKKEGELLTRIVYDTTRLRKGVNQVLTRFVQTLLTFVATVGVLFWVDAFLASAMGFGGLLALYLMGRGTRKVTKAARKNRKKEGKLAALVADELLAIRDLQTFRPTAGTSPAFERVNGKSLKQEGRIRRLGSQLLLRVEILISASVAAILYLGADRVAQGAMSAGDLVLFITYATSLYRPFFQFARQSTRLGTTIAAGRRIERLLTREPAIADAPDAVELERLDGRLTLDAVTIRRGRKRDGDRRFALRDVSLDIPRGRRVAVIGPNGAGKSTLLRAVLRLTRPKSGRILLDGHPIERYTVASLRHRMSVVFQGSVFFGFTIRENLRLGRPDATDDEICGALDRVGALTLVSRLPDGLDTVVHKGGALLSAGQRQRLAVARALLTDGDVWLLDEPTTSLDAEGSEAVTDALMEATRGRTTLWVTHDPRQAARLDDVLILTQGSVVLYGAAEGAA